MLNPENPAHKFVLEIGGAKHETFRRRFDYIAKVIPELVMFNLGQLSDMEYMLMGMQYEEILNKQLRE